MGARVKKSLDLRDMVKNEKIEDAALKTVSQSVKLMYNGTAITKFEVNIDKNKNMSIKIIELPTK